MRKILLLFLMGALLPRAAMAQGTPTDDTFTVSDLTYDGDMDGYYFIVSLEGSRIYTAYNLDIFLPNGIDVMHEGDNYFVARMDNTDLYTKPKFGDWSHTVSASMPAEHQLRVACVSGNSTEFKSTSGELFYVYVTVDADYFASCFSPKPIVRLSGMNLTTKAEAKYVPADFACRPFTTGIPTARTIPVNVSAENKIGTLILPFDTELPEGLKAYSCEEVSGEQLVLTAASSIESCKPYIVYAPGGYTGNLNGTASLSDDSNVTDVFTDGLLTGVLTGSSINTGFILQNQGDGPMFYDTDGGIFTLPAGRCYLTPSGSDVKAFIINFDTESKINDVRSKTEDVRSEIYDLSGRQVISPTSGIYIKGTQKVIIK